MMKIDNYPVYNASNDTVNCKLVGPEGNAMGGFDIPPRTFRWFDQPSGMVFKFFRKENCLFQIKTGRSKYLIL
ncbi:hypothetical protein ML462_01710 [Gramella lutea]|uniref:Uncharacterized protein n=1 Tax=Christiangramia lutea TaxID=1607951 RepID=A0A9X2A7W0_9FLAO|nr:hypothetical protein [Christiangramia lutea]MCH4821874.1 hypothetical protein [Christiangramia lutea]